MERNKLQAFYTDHTSEPASIVSADKSHYTYIFFRGLCLIYINITTKYIELILNCVYCENSGFEDLKAKYKQVGGDLHKLKYK